jgi:hypothetical protein
VIITSHPIPSITLHTHTPSQTSPPPAPPSNTQQSNKSVPQGDQLNDLLSMGSETAEFIKTSIVQAKVNNKGNFEMKLTNEHAGANLEPITTDMKLPRVKK